MTSVPLSRRQQVRVLGDRDRPELLELCAADSVANVFLAERLTNRAPLARGGQVWGYYERGRLLSACWSGANLVLVEATPAAVDAFAARALDQGRRCSSIFGPADPTLALWARLQPFWSRPRDVRPNQPLMAMTGDAVVPADPAVRLGNDHDLPALVPACVAMFTEVVGYSPLEVDGGWAYRARVMQLVTTGRSFVRTGSTGGQIAFKAEIGAVSAQVAQIQGVWVDPIWRGQGLAAPAMASVVNLTRRHVVPTVSLYVNDFNHRALAVYRKVGFTQVGTFATVLF